MLLIADVAALVAEAEAAMAKLARFLSEFAEDCTVLLKVSVRRDSSSRMVSSSAEIDDVIVVSEVVSVETVVLSLPL